MSILFLRYPQYGYQTIKAIRECLTIPSYQRVENHRGPTPWNDVTIRWGGGSHLYINAPVSLNNPSYFPNKGQFVRALDNFCPGIQPPLWKRNDYIPDELYVVRPNKHFGGRNFHLVEGRGVRLSNNWYARKYIPKVREERIFVFLNKIICVSNKEPENQEDYCWNHTYGSMFSNVRWSQWNLDGCRKALKAVEISGLDFAVVDVMYDTEGKGYVLEVNKAPGIPRNSDNSPNIKHRYIAKCIEHHFQLNNWSPLVIPEVFESWRDLIHPCVITP